MDERDRPSEDRDLNATGASSAHILAHWHIYTHEHEFVVCNTLDAPAAANFPAVQEAHVADELAPVALEYVPPGQELHSAAPVSAEPARVERIRS